MISRNILTLFPFFFFVSVIVCLSVCVCLYVCGKRKTTAIGALLVLIGDICCICSFSFLLFWPVALRCISVFFPMCSDGHVCGDCNWSDDDFGDVS